MLRAYHQVLSNKGSAGVDGMAVKVLWEHLDKNREKIALEVCNGTYLPQAILGVEIPKSNGKTGVFHELWGVFHELCHDLN